MINKCEYTNAIQENMFALSKNNKKLTDKLIWIAGTARSGTSIGGKLISTFKNVEYFFEPETLYSVLPFYNKINFSLWKIIFEIYLIEDLYFNSITGRNLNFNKNDDSFIFLSHSKKEIYKRINSRIKRKNFLNQKINYKKTIVIKSLDMTKFLVEIQKKYPKIKFVFFKRNMKDTIKSLVNKKWFNTTKYNSDIFPMVKKGSNYYPIWLSKNNFSAWLKYNRYERCAFYILEMQKYEKKIKNKIVLDYDKLLDDPLDYSKVISKKLNLKFGSNTLKIIKTIKRSRKHNVKNFYKQIRPELRKKLSIDF